MNRSPQPPQFANCPDALARGREKAAVVLKHLLYWKASTGAILQALVGTGERSYAARLAHPRCGMLQRVKVGPTVRGGHLFMLTPVGLAAAHALVGERIPAASRPSELPTTELAHLLATQRAVLRHFHGGFSVLPGRLARQGNEPDALISMDVWRACVECELTAKTSANLERALWKGVEGLRSGRWHDVYYVSDDSRLLSKYERRLAEPLRQWWKLDDGTWCPGDEHEVTEEELAHFHFVECGHLRVDMSDLAR